MRPARVFDPFAGTRSWSDVWAEAGHDVFTNDLDLKFDTDAHVDVLTLSYRDLPWVPDVALLSPPCTAYSTGSFRHHWRATAPCRCGGLLLRVAKERWDHETMVGACPKPVATRPPDMVPKSDTARTGLALLRWSLRMLDDLRVPLFVIENPRAGMRRMPDLAHLDRRTVTYCRYGRPNMKATDLWGGFPEGLELKEPCSCPRGPDDWVWHDAGRGLKKYRVDRNTGKPCHEAAPRGEGEQGTQSLTTTEAGMIPRELAEDVYRAMEADLIANGRLG